MARTLKKSYNFFLLNLFCSMKYSKSKSKPCRKHKKLAVSSRCVSSASCRAILTRQQLINLRNVSKYFHIFLLNKSKLNAREIFWVYFLRNGIFSPPSSQFPSPPSPKKKESNSKFDKPAGRDANLLGLRSSPEEIVVKLKCIIVEEMTFDQELCLKVSKSV